MDGGVSIAGECTLSIDMIGIYNSRKVKRQEKVRQETIEEYKIGWNTI